MSAEFRFEKNSVQSLRQSVYKNIRDAIIKGHLAPGSRLREVDIAEQMGVSRGPIREALRILEQEGLIVSHPYRETVVTDISHEETEQVLVPIRRIIEAHAIKYAVETFTEKEFGELESIVEEMRLAGENDDLDTISDLDAKFHQYIVEKSISPSILPVWNSIIGKIHIRFLILGIRHDSLYDVVQEHSDFIKLLRSRDLILLEAHLMKHIV